MDVATITSKGQVTIPKGIRDRLKLVPGDQLLFQIEGDGAMRVTLRTSTSNEGFGILRRSGLKPVSVERMKSDLRAAFGRSQEKL